MDDKTSINSQSTFILLNSSNWESAPYRLPEFGETFEKYRILSLLGKGGFGAVFLVRNLNLGRDEALKMILPEAQSEVSDIHKRFAREVDVISRLEHPNIVRMYDFGKRSDGSLWMSMEYIKGIRLDDKLKEGPIPFALAKKYMLQILSALREAHRLQIVHRDLKPANIVISNKEGYEDLVTILDFGLSKALGDSEQESVQYLTLASERRVYGTPQYMAPEQLTTMEAGPWSDIYACGLLFYEMLTGVPAVTGESLFDIAYKQSYATPSFPEYLRNTSAEQLILKAIAKNIEDRYKSIKDFYKALNWLQDVQSINPPKNLNSKSGKFSSPSFEKLSSPPSKAEPQNKRFIHFVLISLIIIVFIATVLVFLLFVV